MRVDQSGFNTYSYIHELMFRDPCGIEDTRNEYFYITGNTEGKIGNLSNQVAKFGPNGFIEFLPSLKTERTRHACAGYYNAQDHFVLLVAGGQDISRGESSTSIIICMILCSDFFPCSFVTIEYYWFYIENFVIM